jgi:hypothetical protein
MALMLPIAL